MKVLHITNNYPTPKFPIFGIFVKEQIESLSKLGVENEVFFINGREKGKGEYLRSIFKIRKFIRGKHYDIVHCHHAFSAVCFILSGGTKKFKTIVSYQNDPLNENGKKLYEFIHKRVDAIIVKNSSPAVNNKDIFYLPNGVNMNFFRPISREMSIKKLNLDIDKKYVLFVSSNFIRKQKRYDRFCQVLEILHEKYKLTNIEELKLINTERHLVPYYFNAASLHLLTSDFEGSPNSVKEAMSCNIPVVATNVGNVKEMLSDTTNCFVSDSFNTEELAYLCNKVLKIKGNPRNFILKKNLDMKSVASQLNYIYTNIINNNDYPQKSEF